MSLVNDVVIDERRLIRLRDRSVIKRDGYARRIRFISDLTARCLDDLKDVPQLLVAAESLDRLWSSFSVEDDAVLDHLIELDSFSEYSHDLSFEVSALVVRNLAKIQFRPARPYIPVMILQLKKRLLLRRKLSVNLRPRRVMCR